MDRRGFVMQSVAGATGLSLAASIPHAVLGANDRLRIGLIGCGGRGSFLLQQVLRLAKSQNVEVVALCDVWRVNLHKAAAAVGSRQERKPRLFARYGELLDMPDLDAVIIATPDFAHTTILIEATKRKKDVYVEKPMSSALDQANLAVKLVHEAKTVVQVGTQRRSDARHQAARP